MRVKVGAEVISNYNSFDIYQHPKNKSVNKKRKRLSDLKNDTMIGQQFDFKKYHVCYDPNINKKNHAPEDSKIYLPISNLDVINEQHGIQCADTNGVLQFLLLPRGTSIDECRKYKTMETLQFLNNNRP